jgi:hypothetical protein
VTVTFSLGTDSSSNPANSGDAGPSSESSAVSRYEDVVVVAVDVGESDCGGSCWCEPFAADDDGDAVLRCREAGRVDISGAARDLAARGTRHLDPLAFSRVSPRAFPVGSLEGVASVGSDASRRGVGCRRCRVLWTCGRNESRHPFSVRQREPVGHKRGGDTDPWVPILTLRKWSQKKLVESGDLHAGGVGC